MRIKESCALQGASYLQSAVHWYRKQELSSSCLKTWSTGFPALASSASGAVRSPHTPPLAKCLG